MCLIYRPNVQKNDRRKEICEVFGKIYQDFTPDPKETLINTFLPFFKMYSKTETRTFFKTAKRTLRFNQLFPNTIICDGCSCEKEDPVLLDPACKARKCVIDKGIEHCGYCDRYPCEIFPAEPTQEELVKKLTLKNNGYGMMKSLWKHIPAKRIWMSSEKTNEFI